MKIECLKEKLKNAVSIVEKIAGKNLTLPILSNILIIAEGKTIKLRATNLDLGIEVELPVKVLKEGITAIPADIFSNFLSTIQNETVILELKEENLIISTKNSSTLIKSFPHDDFPTLPIVLKGESFTLSSDVFIEGIKSVSYSASFSDIKPEISSINIYTNNKNNIVFVATDSFRLAEKKITLSLDQKISSLLIPFKNINEIIRIFSLENSFISKEIKGIFNKNQISFISDGIHITSRLIDGIFPDYEQIFPKEVSTEAIILKQDFINALKLTNLFSDKFNQITLTLKPKDKIFEISSKNFDIGENKIQLDCALSGDPISLNFNHKYIIDCFQSIQKDSISLQFHRESKPLVIQGVGDKLFTYLVMPLNQ